jgi:hypothetical protein
MTNEEIKQAMEELGLVPEDFLAVKQATSFFEAKEVLGVLKAKARRGFRKAALRLHPDVGGDAALFIRVKEVLDNVEALQVRMPPPRRPVRYVPMHVTFVNHGIGTASSTTSTTYEWNPPGVYRVVWAT